MKTPKMDQELRRLMDTIDLRDIHPVGILARLTGDPPIRGGPIILEVKSTIRHRWSSPPNRFDVLGRFALNARSGRSESKTRAKNFVLLRYEIVASYQVRSEPAPATRSAPSFLDEAVLDIFSNTNGMIHLWPYFRTYVSSVLGVLGLPPFPLPVWRLKEAQGTLDRK